MIFRNSCDQNNFVTVLCETPHYPNDYYYLNYTNKWKSIEKKNEKLTVIRSKAFASNRSNSVKKIIHYLVFMLSAITNLHKIKSFDLIIISSPPLFTGVIGIFIKKFIEKEFWLDIRPLARFSIRAQSNFKWHYIQARKIP